MDDPYAVLGLPPGTDARTVNSVFRALARDLHPERYVGAPEEERAAAEARFKEVSAAFAAIKADRAERRSWGPITPGASVAVMMAGMVLVVGIVLAGVVATALGRGSRLGTEADQARAALATISVVREGAAAPHSAVLSAKRLGDYVVVQLDGEDALLPTDLANSCVHDGAHAWRTDSVMELSESYVVRYAVPLDAGHEVRLPGGAVDNDGDDLSFLYACNVDYTAAPLAAALFAP